mgnify:CR=1 FL=1
MNWIAAATTLVILAATGCSSTGGEDVITVSAASSLTDAFTEIGTDFENQNPGAHVRFNFGSSTTLAAQINAGAPVDVFASASRSAMDRTAEEGATDEADPFAENSLTIVVPRGNPANVRSLADLQRKEVTVVHCIATAPCGQATQQLLAKHGLEVTASSLEPDVRSVLAKITADEADAGIVYRTDAAAENTLIEEVAIPDADTVTNTYFIASTSEAPSAAAQFIDFVSEEEGVRILTRWGFGRP